MDFPYDLRFSELPERIMIFGPPGTGKTFTLEHIFNIYMIEKQNNNGIYITYSKAMAAEARERLQLGKDMVGTFHSIFSRYLGWNKESFLNDADYTEFCNKYGLKKKVDLDDVDIMEPIEMDDLTYFLSNYNYLYSSYFEKPERHFDIITEKMMNDSYQGKFDFQYLFDKYEEFKFKKGKKDYTDILVEIARNPELLPYLDFIEVDEVQDLRPIMWHILDKWAEKVDKVIYAGDDDQNLYYYDNADVNLMLEHRKDAELYHLHQSYRIPKKIHGIALSLIKNVQNRENKDFEPTQENGEVLFLNDISYAIDYLNNLPGSKFILARSSFLIEKIAKIMIDLGIPFSVINPRHRYFSPYSYSDFDFVNIFLNFPPDDLMQIRKIITHLPASILIRGVKTAMEKKQMDKLPITIDKYSDNSIFYSFFRKKLSKEQIYEYLDLPIEKKINIKKLISKGRPIDVNQVIRIDTIHASKGKEADNVLFVNNITRKVYENTYLNQDIFDAEIRTKYVGLTRARKVLLIVSDMNLSTYTFVA
jgi:DNA helicase-2/ATP-dependent DNA helicase PcrA